MSGIVQTVGERAASDGPASAPPAMPTGTITFLLTDIEGSARLWDTSPQDMRLAMARHDEIVDAAVARHTGVAVRPRGEGDSRFAVFRRATDAVAAAVDIQLALQHEVWNLSEQLRVHLGLHSGEVDERDGDYYGGAVNRCGRIRGLAHGGQILLSGATFDLVQDAPDGWPADAAPRLLGEYHLRGLARPERIFELSVAGLAADFPPLAVDGPEPPNNLPAPVTRFIGRERELAQVEQLLAEVDVRLVTLTGAGGVGKTRLAEQVARRVLPTFPDGVFLVSLAAVTDATLVASAVRETLGIFDSSDQNVVESLVSRLAHQQLLLVLDNFEHVREAAPTVAELLGACPRLKVLVTSRSRLRLRGEHRLEVAPLRIPGADASISELERAESVRLFVDRARSADSDFRLTSRNASSVRELCRTLDGLPLAIELVAARVAEFAPATLVSHLGRQRLTLLTGGPEDAPQRQQSLRGAIAWSHTLLTPAERVLFRRLAVFAGGCTSTDAQEVCELPQDPLEAQAVLNSLAETSLLRVDRADDNELRFRMLETIREFALDELASSGDAAQTRERHAFVFAALLSDTAAHHGGPEEPVWLQRLARELDNLRAAWRWAIDQAQVELALRMAEAALPFLRTYGFTQEGLRWLSEVRKLEADHATPTRARILFDAGWLNHQLGNLTAAEQFFQDAIDHARVAGDLSTTASALGGLAFTLHEQGDVDRALECTEESLALAAEVGDESDRARALTRRAEILALNADIDGGADPAQEAIAAAEAIGDTACLAAALDVLGLVRRLQGDADEAVALLDRAVALHEAMGYKANVAEALLRLADAHLLRGDVDHAEACGTRALRLALDAANQHRVANSLRVGAAVALARGNPDQALDLATGARDLYGSLGHRLAPVEQADIDAVLGTAAARGRTNRRVRITSELVASLLGDDDNGR